MSQAISDNEVVARAVEGDEAAFEILFQRYYGYAVRTALPYVKSSSDANDVAQDAFVRVHRNLKKFRQEARFTTWLHRIVTNLRARGQLVLGSGERRSEPLRCP